MTFQAQLPLCSISSHFHLISYFSNIKLFPYLCHTYHSPNHIDVMNSCPNYVFFFSIRNQLNILKLKNISYYVILLVDRSWWTIQQIFDIFDINEIIQPIEPTEKFSYINETSFFGLFVFAYVFFYIFLWNCTNKSDVHFKFHCSTIYYCSFFPQVNHIKREYMHISIHWYISYIQMQTKNTVIWWIIDYFFKQQNY